MPFRTHYGFWLCSFSLGLRARRTDLMGHKIKWESPNVFLDQRKDCDHMDSLDSITCSSNKVSFKILWKSSLL